MKKWQRCTVDFAKWGNSLQLSTLDRGETVYKFNYINPTPPIATEYPPINPVAKTISSVDRNVWCTLSFKTLALRKQYCHKILTLSIQSISSIVGVFGKIKILIIITLTLIIATLQNTAPWVSQYMSMSEKVGMVYSMLFRTRGRGHVLVWCHTCRSRVYINRARLCQWCILLSILTGRYCEDGSLSHCHLDVSLFLQWYLPCIGDWIQAGSFF